MPAFVATLDNMLNGVSQQPSFRRLPSQCEEQVNMLSDATRGLSRRPPSDHEAIIATTNLSDYTNAFIHHINRDADERYRVVVFNGDIKVFDEDGTEVSVVAPNGKAYLAAGSPTPNLDFRAATVGDTTFIANRKVTVTNTSDTSDAVAYEALLWVKDADYGVTYDVTIDGTNVKHTVDDGTTEGDIDELNTSLIAGHIRDKIESDTTLGPLFTATVIGSTVHVVRDSGGNFTISVADGMGSQGFVAIKGTVNRFEDLPPTAPADFTVEIVGDPGTAFDNYWVKYEEDDAVDGRGVWVETLKPAEKTTLDATTMPHELVRGGVLVDPRAAVALPSPVVSTLYTGTAFTDGFSAAQDTASPENSKPFSNTNGVMFYSNLEDANGVETEYTVSYDIDIPFISGIQTKVQLHWNNGSGWNLAGTHFHNGNEGDKDAGVASGTQDTQFVKILTLDANADLRLTMTHTITLGEDPDGLFTLRMRGESDSPAGVAFNLASTDKQVDFDSTQIYPEGITVNLDLNGNNAPYVVSGGDATGATVATGLETYIDNNPGSFPGVTASISSAGVLKLEGTIPQIETWGENTADDHTGLFEDTFMYAVSPDTNYDGTNPIIILENGNKRRALCRVDLSAETRTATSVKFVWTISAIANGSGNLDLELLEAQQAWVETQATWNDYATSTAWTSAGGDFSAVKETVDLSGKGADDTIEFTSANLKTMVQDAIDGTGGYPTGELSLGFKTVSGSSSENVQPYSQEGTDGKRPYLEITFPSVELAPSVSFDGMETNKVLLTNDLDSAADALIGYTVENLATGGTMVITDNTDKSLRGTTALDVGVFSEGNLCRIVGTGTYFVFRQPTWKARQVGDLENINPWPSFHGNTIQEVFFHANRLGFCSDENAILSQAGDLNNFFRDTATDLLDSDPIDVEALTAEISVLVNAMHWNKQLILSSDQADFVLLGGDLLTPKTAKLPKISSFGNSNRLRPHVAEGDIYFVHGQSGSTQVRRYRPNPRSGREDDNEAPMINSHAPSYLAGNPLAIAGSSKYNMIAVLTDADKSHLFIYKYFDGEDGNRLQSSWSRWEFGADVEILAVDFIDDNMGLVMKHHDAITFVTVPVDPKYKDANSETVVAMDRRVKDTDTGVSMVYDDIEDITIIDLPYEIRFTGNYAYAIDRMIDPDGTEPVAHVPNDGVFENYSAGNVGGAHLNAAATIQNNQMECTLGAASPYEMWMTNQLINDNFSMYIDVQRGSTDQENDKVMMMCRHDQVATVQVSDSVRFGYQRVDATTVNLIVDEVVLDSSNQVSIVTGFAFAADAKIRIGVDISGNTGQMWTEPWGGGTRTNRGSLFTFTEAESAPDPLKARFGLWMRKGNGEVTRAARIAKFVVLRASTDDDGTPLVVTRATAGVEGGTNVPVLSRAELHLNQIAVAGDQTAADLWIGIYTPWSYTYSRQHRREGGAGPGRDRVRSDGWLQLRYFELDYEDTRAFKAVVTYNRTGGGTEKTYSFSSATIAGVDGIHRFPVLSKSDKVTIKLTDSSGHEPATFHRTRWEGVYNRRTRSR